MKAGKKKRKARPSARGGTNRRSAAKAIGTARDQKAAKKGFPIVGIGASAGGYEAVTKFLEKLSLDTGMAFVLIQHLDPTHESRLSELLRRATSLNVVEVTRSLVVEPNHLYVISPNRNLLIERGRLRPIGRPKSEMPPMPIDSFFRSLAEDQRQNGIGIILSGNGADGTLGLEAIKGADGITFAQSPESAKFNGMPGSAIASGCVDFVLPPERMGRELANLRRHTSRAASIEPRVEPGHPLSKIQALLRSHNGVDFSAYKQSTLGRRIQRRMVVHRMAKMEEYVAFLRQHPAELEALAEDVLITVTRFFRDRKSLESLRRHIFPALMEGRAPGTPIRVWVPGCSSGEEVYSLAIMLAEFLGEKSREYPVQLFGTDISEPAIAKARAGVYRGNIALDVSPERLRRFFSPTDDSFRIAKAVRDQCVFARQDLTSDPPFSQLDLISCQNVLIYFGPELQRRVLPVFHYALKPHGYLALGSAESLGGLNELFRHVDSKHRLFQKRPSPRHGEPPFATRPAPPDIASHRELDPLEREPVLPALEKVADRVVLQHCAPAGVVVDAKLQVLQFRGVTAPYLEHKPGAANLNLLKMLREELVLPLRTILAQAAKQQSVVHKDVIWPRAKDQHRLLQISVVPFKAPPHKEALLLVLFKEGARLDLPDAKLSRASRSHPAKAVAGKEVKRLREELEVTRESLQAIIEEQEATNEELKSANEESQSTNEELQSTNEELETAKEEMQSTNEELSTVNDELRHANLDSTRANNDLINLLGSVQIPVVMVDSDLKVRRYTPAAQRFFNLIPTDIGRSVSDIKHSFVVENLDDAIREVIDTLHLKEVQVRDREGRWFALRIRAYRTKDNKIDGAVLALIDIDEFKRGLEHLGDMLWEPFLTLTKDLRVIKANQVFYEKFRVKPEETEGRYLYELGNRQWDNPRLRKLLEEILPERARIKDFPIEHKFPGIGLRKMLLNARQVDGGANGHDVILLAMRDLKTAAEN